MIKNVRYNKELECYEVDCYVTAYISSDYMWDIIRETNPDVKKYCANICNMIPEITRDPEDELYCKLTFVDNDHSTTDVNLSKGSILIEIDNYEIPINMESSDTEGFPMSLFRDAKQSDIIKFDVIKDVLCPKHITPKMQSIERIKVIQHMNVSLGMNNNQTFVDQFRKMLIDYQKMHFTVRSVDLYHLVEVE